MEPPLIRDRKKIMDLDFDSDFVNIRVIHCTQNCPIKVLAGRSRSRDADVVYKIIEYSSSTKGFYHRLEIEARMLQELQSPNICKLLEYKHVKLESCSYFCIVMEKLEEDWESEIKGRLRPYPETTLWERLLVLVGVLACLQEKSIAHRDIKPQNIFLSGGEHPRVKLGDFDACKRICEETNLSSIQGTPLYLSPALRRAHSRSHKKACHDVYKSDVFSLGMSFMHAAWLKDIGNPIDEQEFRDLKEKILEELNYSTRFKTCLNTMLTYDEDSRPDFISLARSLYVIPNLESELPRLSISTKCYNCSEELNQGPFLTLPCHHLVTFCSPSCLQNFESDHREDTFLQCGECQYKCKYNALSPYFPQLLPLF